MGAHPVQGYLADSPSRLLQDDLWPAEHGFSVRWSTLPSEVWCLTWTEMLSALSSKRKEKEAQQAVCVSALIEQRWEQAQLEHRWR